MGTPMAKDKNNSKIQLHDGIHRAEHQHVIVARNTTLKDLFYSSMEYEDEMTKKFHICLPSRRNNRFLSLITYTKRFKKSKFYLF